LAGVTGDNVLIQMGEYNRIEDLTLNLSSSGECNLTGILFGGTSTATSKVRTCVLNVSTPNNTDYINNVYGVNAGGTGGLTNSSFSFNCIKGSTINVNASGGGNVRGILVSGTNVMSTRDVNIFVNAPYTGSLGSYVGVETNDAGGTGSIQMRSTTVGAVRRPSIELWVSSDILQTTPANVTDPTYLASPGIQVGPGVDLVTKSAGGRPFSLFTYPTTIYYGLKGTISSGPAGYLWPGTQAVSAGVFPDPGLPAAYYRVQQPAILCGLNVSCTTGPDAETTTVQVYYTPKAGGAITPIAGFNAVLSGAGATSISYYNSTQNLGSGDRIHVGLTYSGNNSSNKTHDVTIQLDMF